MKIDRYTKTILTVIALCLVWLCVHDHVIQQSVAEVERTPLRVIIAGVQIPNVEGGIIPISIREIRIPDPPGSKLAQLSKVPVVIR